MLAAASSLRNGGKKSDAKWREESFEMAGNIYDTLFYVVDVDDSSPTLLYSLITPRLSPLRHGCLLPTSIHMIAALERRIADGADDTSNAVVCRSSEVGFGLIIIIIISAVQTHYQYNDFATNFDARIRRRGRRLRRLPLPIIINPPFRHSPLSAYATT